MTDSNSQTLVITEAQAGNRLDSLLATLYPAFSRSALARAIRENMVLLDNRPVKPSFMVKTGQILTVILPVHETANLRPSPEIILDILYEDEELLVINKPPGLVVHPGAGCRHETLAGALLALYPDLAEVGDKERPGLVHRLDKDTSGIMVVAKTEETRVFLSQAFADRRVSKRYLAFVTGNPPADSLIEESIGRHPFQRVKMAAGLADGRPARTRCQVLKRFEKIKVALVYLTLYTGRTHQARVHLASIGCPVVGDSLYATNSNDFFRKFPQLKPFLHRQLLHARRLSFPHPKNGEMSFRAPWPFDFREFLKKLIQIDNNSL